MPHSSVMIQNRLTPVAWLLLAIGVPLVGATTLQFRSTLVVSPELVVLACLALLAELWPVSFSQRGLRITLTLPFVLGVFLLGGPVAAIVVDCGVSLLAALGIRYSTKQRIHPVWIIINILVAAISSALAVLMAKLTHVSVTDSVQTFMLPVFVFVLSYATVNLFLVSMVEKLMTGNLMRDSLLGSVRPSLQAIALYFLISAVVAVLIRANLAEWCAITIIPVVALRHAIQAEARLYESYYETISGLSLMLQRAHPYTHGHLRRVSLIAEEVAIRLGLKPKRAQLVRVAAVLHDIGKIAVNETVLDKPSKLTDEEFAHVKRHSEFGARIVAPVDDLRLISKWIRHHHERPDGSGYPDNLSDMEIPIESKIIAVVDAYDAMTGGDGKDKRSYREPMTSAEALAELERCSDSQFDRKVVTVFRSVILGGNV